MGATYSKKFLICKSKGKHQEIKAASEKIVTE